ncbi:hypothetical protein RHMOL_Rhmol09G0164900 [Rhododendron molle]|uniref:Uncharacterized protein n=1 Tax=Rhododendron molle TaxID=49168 RepID=A0ACC0MDT7_RHOML|nr:hypothetical protein RHMOL_Rhmol09G0164900 [Rhododendron molle]
MFSSGSGGNPFSYTTETQFTGPPTIEENPNYNSSQEEYPPGSPDLLHFPSPFLDTGGPPQDHDITTINTGATSTSNRRPRKRNGSGGATANPNPNPNPDPDPNPNPNPNSRRRTGKKDRHSKICTAQGLRDRRMRLSVQMARKFFDLQDLLGFDKASKTIEWLFSKSKGAIKEVTRNLPRVNHGRSVDTKAVVEDQESEVHKEDKGKGIEVSVGVLNEENDKSRKKVASYDPHQAKESRDKARERARARTREKMMIRGLGDWKEDDLEGNPNNSLDHEFPAENFHGIASANSSTSPAILGFQTYPGVSDGEDSNNKLMGVGGNWEMENARLIISEYGELTDILPMTGNELQEQNPNPISATSAHFQSQLMSGNQFYCSWQL